MMTLEERQEQVRKLIEIDNKRESRRLARIEKQIEDRQILAFEKAITIEGLLKTTDLQKAFDNMESFSIANLQKVYNKFDIEFEAEEGDILYFL